MAFWTPYWSGRPSWLSQKPVVMLCPFLARHSRSAGKDRNHILRAIQLEAVFRDRQILSLLEIFVELRIDSRFLTERTNPRNSVPRGGREEEVGYAASDSNRADGF